MRGLIDRRSIPLTSFVLVVVLAVLLYVLPPEQTLGNTIKAVFLHGALVQVGLLAFGAAGLLGLACLVWRGDAIYQWCIAAQKAAVVVWIAYVLSSMVATYLAWGVAIAWGEPRVRITANLLGACLLFLALALWLKNRYLTGVVNVVMAGLAWGLTKGAINIRHPFDPIGTSDSALFKWLFAGILAVVLLMAVQVARWLHRGGAVIAAAGAEEDLE